MPSRQEMIDRHVGRLIGEFDELLAQAMRGESVDALKLQAAFTQVAQRSWELLRTKRKAKP